MSALTKALVVVVTILSIALVALVVPFVAKADDYGTRIANLDTRLRIAEALASEAQRLRDSEQAAESARLANLRSQITALTTDMASEQQKTLTQSGRATDLQREKASLETQMKLLQNENTISATAARNFAAQIGDIQSASLEKNLKIASLTDRVQELTTENQVLELNVNQMQERIVSLQNELDDERNPVPEVAGGNADEITQINPPISGEVTNVRQPAGGITLAEVNIGKSDRVKENYRFLVYRGSEYVGVLRITTTYPRTAIGELDRVNAQPQVGDKIYAGPMPDRDR